MVREPQDAWWGWTPEYGRLEVRARMELSPRSMAGVWMSGLEDRPERSAEILIFEVFGDALATDDGRPTAAVGMGTRRFRDPAITGDFEAPRLGIDVTRFHDYAAEWRPGRVDILVDGRHVKTVDEAPDYPMQMMVALFDFPDKADSAPPDHVTIMRALVKQTLGHSLVTALAADIAEACETLDQKGGLHEIDRRRVKTGTGY